MMTARTGHPRALWLLLSALSVPAAIAQDGPSERFRAVDAYERPDYTLDTVDSQSLSADTWDGKVVLVDFWASWCVPCRREMPEFNRLRAEYADQGFEVVGIAADGVGQGARISQRGPRYISDRLRRRRRNHGHQ